MQRISLLFSICFLNILTPIFAQNQSDQNLQNNYKISIKRASSAIEIDGELSEQAWQNAEVVSDFWLKFPRDNVKAERKTEVRLTYDDRYLYISAICKDTSHYVVQTLKRDSRFFEGDAFGVVLDPTNTKSNGFLFGVSPLNVQSEDLISTTAFGNLNFSWDNKWLSAVTRHDDEWIVEMAIPFKTLRFDTNSDTWGINFFRNDLKKNEVHSWTKMPVNFEVYDIGYTGALQWDRPPSKTGTNISIIPYLSGSTYKDKENSSPTESKFDGGFDAKVAVTSSISLDLTVNPDFSQIDVDVQQTNLTRFNLRFPERRPFFLENNDLFTNFGTPPARPIFTRAIGLDKNALPIPIAYGARLSGNINNSLRVGLLNLQTKSNEDNDAQNYSIATFNQSVLKRSVIKGYMTNKQAIKSDNGDNTKDYNRNAGLELNYKNVPGTWNPWVAMHISKTPDTKLSTFRNAGLQYRGRKWDAFLDYIGIDTDYTTGIGFLQRIENYDAINDTIVRLGYEHFFGRLRYTHRPANAKIINAHRFSVFYRGDWNPDLSFNEGVSGIGYTAQFNNTGELNFNIDSNDVHLLYGTSFTDGEPLPPDTYKFSTVSLGYISDARKPLAMEAEVEIGGFYNGNLSRYLAGFTYRAQPWGNFSVIIEQNNLKLPQPYTSENLLLINQRTEINFSNKLFWTTFLQYNTQNDNFNINSRLQWRYMPMSDLFIGYTDNYFSDPFLKSKNRGVVFKMNYWFTM